MSNEQIKDRARGAIWGQLLADAACLGTHWIYDLDALYSTYPDPKGFEEPREGHYHAGKKPGDQTHYGEAARVMLESVSRLGQFNAADFGAKFIEFFGTPDYRGYLDKATRGTLENYRAFMDHQALHPGEPFDYQQGADDDQLATASRLAPVVVAHREDPALLTVVEHATRVCQNNGRAVATMKANALILKAALEGRDLEEAAEEVAAKMPEIDPEFGPDVRDEIRAAVADPRSIMEVTLDFGQSCPLPHSFPSALHAALKHRHSFEDAVIATLHAGGDNAGRAAMLGAWVGACVGERGIPAVWRRRLSGTEVVREQIEALIGKVI